MKGFFEDTEDDFIEQVYKPVQKRQPKVFENVRNIPTQMGFDEKSGNLLVTPCQCEFSDSPNGIFCDRHKCLKSKSLHTLCQTRQDYFQLWEDGVGPMQNAFDNQMKKRGYEQIEITEEEEVIVKKEEEEEKKFFMNDPRIPAKSRGLGDTIAKVTKATGIKKAVDTVFGAINKDCGCTERQAKLNRMFPYGKGKEPPKKTKGFFE
jgi:hypothetical protein